MTLTRDLIGYGRNPPHAAWPGGARIAVNFVLNYEEGSEYSIPDGDGFSETGLSEGAEPGAARHARSHAPSRSTNSAAASGSGA